MLGFIIILILLLIGTVVWSIRVKENSEGNKFIRLLPYWVIAYGVSMALLCPVAFFSIWEYNIDFILTCVVLSIALLIIAADYCSLCCCHHKETISQCRKNRGNRCIVDNLYIYCISVRWNGGRGI